MKVAAVAPIMAILAIQVHIVADIKAAQTVPDHNSKKEKMKKTKAFYQIIVFALIVVSVIMFSGIAKAAADTVDGFVGVPWGASKQQVAKEMAQRDFKQVAEGTNYVVYGGTFADLPADLTFGFGKNGFYMGEADVTTTRDMFRKGILVTYSANIIRDSY